MLLACSTRSFSRDRLEIALAKVAWAGYQGVEMALEDAPSDTSWLRERLQNNQLRMADIHAGALGAADREAALEGAARIGRLALLAREMDGSRVVVTAPEQGDFEALAYGLRALLGALERLPVAVCVANSAGTLVATPENLARLNEAVPAPAHALALDPGQALLAGWDPAQPERWPAVPQVVYLNDARAGCLRPPGAGEVDWPRLAAALRGAGFDGAVTLALVGAHDYEVEPAAREARLAAEEWFGVGV
ncbi:MAG: sugar phosphate isomerase/epimerase [Armatimonadetes bacterium]|nr:sugar phosphate isomerase/epimerase [Armatimonadota bacterium]